MTEMKTISYNVISYVGCGFAIEFFDGFIS